MTDQHPPEPPEPPPESKPFRPQYPPPPVAEPLQPWDKGWGVGAHARGDHSWVPPERGQGPQAPKSKWAKWTPLWILIAIVVITSLCIGALSLFSDDDPDKGEVAVAPPITQSQVEGVT